ncbi:LuxR C-terminal-related transcriptional regulator [Desertihabitans aurantiacus]|uniref:LuxR C-terminal-related transcriptional regulator n=1 Tax=Desertihabitans aurantiacus TaxID=2282477 RepID=UPI000DF81CA1|nr:LuxR C-terminal-related transcriptional regulator [Desertihabitans aurantiacus]
MNPDRIVPELQDAVVEADHRAVAAKVERHWGFVLRTDYPLLGRALARLPKEYVRPTHRLVRGVLQPSTWAGPTHSPDEVIDAALETIPAAEDDPQLQVSTGIAVLHGLRRQGRLGDAGELARQLVEPAGALPGTEANSHVASLYLHLGSLELLSADARGAERWFEAAYRQPSAFANHAADAAGRLALIGALRGETARAEAWLGRAAEWDAAAAHWPLRAAERLPQLCARALLALDRLDWAAYHRYDDQIEAERIDLDEHWAFVLHHRALAAVLRGNQRAVLEEIDDHRRHHPQYFREPNLATALLETAEIALLMTIGRYDEALTLLDATDRGRAHQASVAHLLLAGGRVQQAADLSDPRLWPPRTTRRQQLLMLVAHAGAQYRLGRTSAAVAALRQAVNLTGARSEAHLYAFAVMDRYALMTLAEQVPELVPMVTVLQERARVEPPDAPDVRLTPRETVVLRYLAGGLDIARISEALYVSPSTVKNQRKSIYRKLGATNRKQALERASRLGLLPAGIEIVSPSSPDSGG